VSAAWNQEAHMSEGSSIAAVLLGLLVVLPALPGLVLERLRPERRGVEALLNADNARAKATLAYYNEVHDSHGG